MGVTLLQIKENSSAIFYKINCTYPYVVWPKCNIPRLVFIHGGTWGIRGRGKILLVLQGIEPRMVEFQSVAKLPYPLN